MAYTPTTTLSPDDQGALQGILQVLMLMASNQPIRDNMGRQVVLLSSSLLSNLSCNVAQFGGTNVVTGLGVSGTGIPRITPSNDTFAGAPAYVSQQSLTNAGLTSIYAGIATS